MASPNVANLSIVTGKTEVLAVTTTPTNVVTNSASSGKVYKVNMLTIANVDGTNAADITASFYRNSVEYALVSTVSVPADASLVVLSKETGVYLEEGDAIRLTASADNDLVAVCSYEDIS